MRTKILAGLALSMMTVLGVSAQQDMLSTPFPIDPAVRMGKLDNGLTYIIRHNERPEKRAQFYIAQKVGSMQEQDHQAGLAHFLEHLAFNGTEHFKGKNLIDFLEKNGVKFGSNLNAYTSFDETLYQIMDAPTSRQSFVDSCLLILSDWSSAISLEDEEIDKERGVIHEEWRSRDNGMMRAYNDLFLKAFPPGHQYGKRMPIGSMDVVMNFKPETIRDYYHTWYRPDLQGIIVVGDIDVDRIEAKIKELFGGFKVPEGAPERVYVDVPDHTAPISIVETNPEIVGTSLSVMYSSDALTREEKATPMAMVQQYMTAMITTMMNQRFAEEALKPDAPFLEASLSYGSYLVAITEDALSLDVTTKEGGYKQGLDAAVKLFKQAVEYGFTPGEYDRARTDYLTSFDNMLQSKDSRTSKAYAMEYANYFTQGGYIPGIEVEHQFIHALAPQIPVDAINGTLQEMVKGNKNLTVTLMAPEKEGLSYPDEKQLLTEYNTALEQEVKPYEEKVVDTKLIDEMPLSGIIAKETPDQPYGSTLIELSNGIKVYLQPLTYDKNKVSLYGYKEGGRSTFDFAKDPVTLRALEFAGVGGVGKFSPIDLSKALTGRTASASTGIAEFRDEVSGGSTTKDIETMLQLAYLDLTNIREDQSLFDTAQKNELASLEASKADPMNTVLKDSVPALFYPGELRAKALTKEDIESIDYKHVLDVYRSRFADAGDFTFILSGDFNIDSVKPLVARYLGALSNVEGSDKADYSKAIRRAAKGRTSHFDVPMDNPIATVVDSYVIDWEYNLKNQLIAGILSDVLNQTYLVSIRENEGGTYGVSVQGGVNRYPAGEASLLIFFQTNPESAVRLNDIVKKELSEVVKNGVNEEYFKKAILNREKSFTERQTSNDYWMGLLSDKVMYNENNHEVYLDTLHSITPDDVKNLVNKYLTEGRYSEMIASGVAKK